MPGSARETSTRWNTLSAGRQLGAVARTLADAVCSSRISSVTLLALSTIFWGTACESELSCTETATCPPMGSDGGSERDQGVGDRSLDQGSLLDGTGAANDVTVNPDGNDGGRGDASTMDAATDTRADSRDVSTDAAADGRPADAHRDSSSEQPMDGGWVGDSAIDVAPPDTTEPDGDAPDVPREDAADGGSTIDAVIGCNSSTCPSGCCNANNQCVTTPSPAACGGWGGGMCQACAAGQECNGTSCVCTAASCPMGCCAGSACMPYASQSDMACGTGGAACAGCGAEKMCSAGICTSIADDIWAVGDAIIHWTKATAWALQPSPNALLRDVWGTDRSNVWAVGEGGTILHYDGMQWEQVASPTTQSLRAIWGSSRSDVWAVGYDNTYDRGLVIRYDGNAWTDMGHVTAWDNLRFDSISGTGPRDIWAIGVSTTGTVMSKMFHFGPLANWTDETPPRAGTTYMTSIWMTTSSGWAVGRDTTTMLRFNGTSWVSIDPVPTTSNLQAVSGISANDVWALGWHSLDVATENSSLQWLHVDAGRTRHVLAGIDGYLSAISAGRLVRGPRRKHLALRWCAAVPGCNGPHASCPPRRVGCPLACHTRISADYIDSQHLLESLRISR